jgi:hypothetical protein
MLHLQLQEKLSSSQNIAQGYQPKLVQKCLTQWYRETCPTSQELIRLCQAYPSLDTRLTHVSPIQYTGPHKPFDLHHKITIQHQPNAFLKTLLPIQEDCMSKHQMSLYLKLLLGGMSWPNGHGLGLAIV